MSGHADLIVTNANITTLDEKRPDATAMAVRDGKFISVGDEADVVSYRSDRTQVVHAAGRRIIPGLNDSHIHVIRGGLNFNLELRWDGIGCLGDALALLKHQAQRTPPPQWVRVVGGWSEFQSAERRMPTLKRGGARHSSIRAISLRSCVAERRGVARGWLYEGHARSAWGTE